VVLLAFNTGKQMVENILWIAFAAAIGNGLNFLD
jgi:hypothetical protein